MFDGILWNETLVKTAAIDEYTQGAVRYFPVYPTSSGSSRLVGMLNGSFIACRATNKTGITATSNRTRLWS